MTQPHAIQLLSPNEPIDMANVRRLAEEIFKDRMAEREEADEDDDPAHHALEVSIEARTAFLTAVAFEKAWREAAPELAAQTVALSLDQYREAIRRQGMQDAFRETLEIMSSVLPDNLPPDPHSWPSIRAGQVMELIKLIGQRMQAR